MLELAGGEQDDEMRAEAFGLTATTSFGLVVILETGLKLEVIREPDEVLGRRLRESLVWDKAGIWVGGCGGTEEEGCDGMCLWVRVFGRRVDLIDRGCSTMLEMETTRFEQNKELTGVDRADTLNQRVEWQFNGIVDTKLANV